MSEIGSFKGLYSVKIEKLTMVTKLKSMSNEITRYVIIFNGNFRSLSDFRQKIISRTRKLLLKGFSIHFCSISHTRTDVLNNCTQRLR
jgi:hypothetical protein